MANNHAPTSQILKTFENVLFPEFSKLPVKAKIDTGAYSGAIHCQKIQEKNGILFFTPLDGRKMYKADNFMLRQVTSSNGHRTRRYFIQTKLTVKGKTYPIIISLSDRSEMKWPVLIGRRFLRQNKFLVDAGSR